jgi:hypothetical protein
MDHPTQSPPQSPFGVTPVTYTTRRGIATASFALGMWGSLVFWWYPFGMCLCSVGLVLGIISVIMGYRVKADVTGEPLAWAGIGFSSLGLSLGVAVYRFMQMAFEGSPPFWFAWFDITI